MMDNIPALADAPKLPRIFERQFVARVRRGHHPKSRRPPKRSCAR